MRREFQRYTATPQVQRENAIFLDAPIQTRVEAPRPRLIEVGGAMAPGAAGDLDALAIPKELLAGLVLKSVHVVPYFTTDWVADQVRLPRVLTSELLDQLMADRLVEVIGQDGPLSYRWAISDKGRQRALQLLKICGYVGPAPVAADTYNSMTEWQCDHLPDVSPIDIAGIRRSLVLTDEAVEIAGLAALSQRSLFLYGPPGNGKTSVGYLLNKCLKGELWIPHCISVGDSVIRVFDPQVHEEAPLDLSREEEASVDRRWVRIKRPFVIAAGELQLDDLDLAYSQALAYYESPLHLKANGGIFMLDDFGYQRMNPFQLLNRWVFPLEHGIDFLTLKTGQKLFVPFRQMLVVSTNLDPESVMEPAILRRIGYRLYLGNPTGPDYARIFKQYAGKYNLMLDDDLLKGLIRRHNKEHRPMRGCVPRDLIERVRDICRYRGHPLRIDDELLDIAWRGYFGNSGAEDDEQSWD